MIVLNDQQLDSLITSRTRNAWVDIVDIDKNLYVGKVYLRISKRIFNGMMQNTLDLSTISIEEEFQNSGYGSDTIKEILKIAKTRIPVYGVYVENVINPILSTILVKKFKFHILAKQLLDRCYFKRIDHQK